MSFRRIANAGVPAMLLTGASVSAQDTGPDREEPPSGPPPIVVGEPDALRPVVLNYVRGAVELFTAWRGQRIRPPDGPTRRDEELELRESIELSTGGFLGHRNLVDFDAFGKFGARQIRSSLDPVGREQARELDPGDPEALDGRRWTLEYLAEYDVNARFIQNSTTPATAHSRRTQTLITRQFGDTLDSVTTGHGVSFSWLSPVAPTELAYFRREQETTSRLGAFDFSLEQDTFSWRTQVQPTESQRLTWDYTYDDVRQRGAQRSTQNFRRHNAQLNHELGFGEDDRHRLRSSLLYFKEEGAFQLERWRWSEALRLRHSTRFHTLYDYALDQTRRPDLTQTQHRGSVGFRHWLFDSLVTTGQVGASRLTLSEPGFTSDRAFADLDAQYRKSVPLGRLTAGAGVSAARQDDSDRDGTIQVVQEPHVFSPVGLVVLDRRGIIPESIVIMDAAGIFTFTPGLDYTVQVFGDRVEIRRIIGGDILDGQAVLIDYRIQVEPANVTDTFGWRLSIRYDIDEGVLQGLGLYTRYAQQEQNRSTELDVLLPATDIRDLIVGADYRIGYLSVLAERRWFDSSISPFRSTRLEGRYAMPLGRGSSINLSADYQDIDRYEDRVRTQITTLNGRWAQQLTDELRLGAQVLWREERNGPGSRVEGLEQQLDLSWRHRQTSVFGMVRNAQVRGGGRDSMFQTLQLGVRREF